MKNLCDMLLESINEAKNPDKKFGTKEVVPEFELKSFKGTPKPVVVVTTKKEGEYNLVYCRIDYWNKALWLRVGITHQDKYCVAAWKTDNIESLDFGPKKNAAVAYVNGYEFDSMRMGGKIQYTFDDSEYTKLKKAFEDENDELIEGLTNTVKTLEEYN